MIKTKRERGNSRGARSLGQSVKKSRTDTRIWQSSRTLPRSHTTCTSASSRDLLEASPEEDGRFSFQRCESRHLAESSLEHPRRRRTVVYSWITPNPPEADNENAHTRFGRLGSRILQACVRTKLGKLRKTLPLLFSDSIVFVFVLGRRRHSLCGRCLASFFRILLSFYLHKVSLLAVPIVGAPRAN